jgi:2-hydroxychromene-2-carboxylate isomerase
VGELLRLSSTKEIKDKLKSTTQEALDHGVREMTLSELFWFV